MKEPANTQSGRTGGVVTVFLLDGPAKNTQGETQKEKEGLLLTVMNSAGMSLLVMNLGNGNNSLYPA